MDTRPSDRSSSRKRAAAGGCRVSARPAPEAAARRALVLSGGIALGAFEAGAFAAIEEADDNLPEWITAASIGAVNAAIIAGNRPGERAAALRRFWSCAASDPTPAVTALLGPPPVSGAWRRAYNEAAALQSLTFGRPGMFRPRMMPGFMIGRAPALFDLAPLTARLREVVDFGRLNAGNPRLSIVATDVVSGERVVFDTAHGTRIGAEHVTASGALLPLFAPVEVEGRLLGDGGLASNAPLDLVLDEPGEGALHCIVLELFTLSGPRPRFLSASLGRATDLAFGNQTSRLLEGRAREYQLLALLGRVADRLPPDLREDPEVAAVLRQVREPPQQTTVVNLHYRPGLDEAGPGKLFDFSSATLAERWAAGENGMREAVQRLLRPERATALAPGLLLHELEAGPDRVPE
ncbi:MAG TPA: patatin-like phospholipase family protein [Rhodopila sp.]